MLGACEPARWTTISWLLWAKADAVEGGRANSPKAGMNMALPPFWHTAPPMRPVVGASAAITSA